MMRISLGTVRAVIPMLLAAVLVSCTALVQARPLAGPDTLPPLPAGWSTTLQLGMSSQPGDATAMAATAPFGLRSQYLAGGVNTGGGWATWGADGAFVADYARESASHGMRSVFDYYMLLHSQPASGADEAGKVSSNLTNVATMTAYYADLKLFYLKVAPFAQTGVILHAEPDLWGYLQQRSRGDDGASVPAVVASSGLPELADLPNTAAGFAQAFIALRDRYAPGVQVAYHLSVWGTGKDILYSRPADATVDELADRAAAYLPLARCPVRPGVRGPDRSRRRIQAVPIRRPRTGVVDRGRLRAERAFHRYLRRRVGTPARALADTARQHQDAGDEQRLGSLPGQPRGVAARRGQPAAPAGLRERRRHRHHLRTGSRRRDLRV